MEEIRLRLGYAPSLLTGGAEYRPKSFEKIIVTEELLTAVLQRATRGAMHQYMANLQEGFLPLLGGHRLGICGSLAMENGLVKNFRHISSLSLRLARSVVGAGAEVIPKLLKENILQSTLIFSPPNRGKTTFLRELIRRASQGDAMASQRVGVVDERGELSAMVEGKAQFHLGEKTDILEGCPKALGMLMMLRSMNPEMLAVDEVTKGADSESLFLLASCGVTLLASVHAGSSLDIVRHPIYREFVKKGLFENYVGIEIRDGKRHYTLYKKEEMEGYFHVPS